MNSTTNRDFAYISSDLPDEVTLREYRRTLTAAARSTGESRLGRATRGLRLGHGALRRPRLTLA